jgi:chromosome segregation ATPase
MPQTDTLIKEDIHASVTQDATETDLMDALEEEIIEQTVEADEETPVEITETPLPQIKGLDALKENIYAVDLDSTIDNMYQVITNMEKQLKNVLKVNASLEKDLQKARDRISELNTNELELKQIIHQLEQEMPSRRELAIELEHLTQERNDDQVTIRAMNKRIVHLKQTIQEYQDQLHVAVEEKNDLLSDVDYMDNTIEISSQKLSDYQAKIQYLKGIEIARGSKINELENQLKASYEERDALKQKLVESRQTISELHGAWRDHRESVKRYQ